MASSPRQLPVAAVGSYDFWSVLGASKVAAVQDASDSDYIFDVNDLFAESFSIDVADLSANHTILALRIRSRLKNQNNAPGADITAGILLGAGFLTQSFQPVNSFQEFVTQEWPLDPTGQPWTYAKVQALQIGVFATGGTASERRCSYLILEVLVDPNATLALAANILQGRCAMTALGLKVQYQAISKSQNLDAKVVNQFDLAVELASNVKALAVESPLSFEAKLQKPATDSFIGLSVPIFDPTPQPKSESCGLGIKIQVSGLRTSVLCSWWVALPTNAAQFLAIDIQKIGEDKPVALSAAIRDQTSVPLALEAKLKESGKEKSVALAAWLATPTDRLLVLSIKVQQTEKTLNLSLASIVVDQTSVPLALEAKLKESGKEKSVALAAKLAAQTEVQVLCGIKIKLTGIDLAQSLAVNVTSLTAPSVALAMNLKVLDVRKNVSLAFWLSLPKNAPLLSAIKVRTDGVDLAQSFAIKVVDLYDLALALALNIKQTDLSNSLALGVKVRKDDVVKFDQPFRVKIQGQGVDSALSLGTKVKTTGVTSALSLETKVKTTGVDQALSLETKVQGSELSAAQALWASILGPGFLPLEFAIDVQDLGFEAPLGLSAYLVPQVLTTKSQELRARIRSAADLAIGLNIKIDDVGTQYTPMAFSVWISGDAGVSPEAITGSGYILPKTAE